MAEDKKARPTTSKRGLGRGLGALFEQEGEARGGQDQEIINLRLNQLEPNRQQPRQVFDDQGLEELAGSIRDQGIISPLIVSPSGRPGTYTIVAGERRWRAARLAGLDSLPVIVRELSREDLQRQALIDNVVRQDLNAMEEAEAYDKLIRDYGLTQENLASALGKSRPAIANTLRLLNLPGQVRDLVRQGQLTPGHARSLLALTDEASQIQLADQVLEKQLTVRETENLLRQLNQAGKAKQKERAGGKEKQDLHTRDMESQLRRALGAQVKLEGGTGPGKIVIRYHSADERERLIDYLLGSRS